MEKGFIKLYRKLTEWEWYTHETTFRVFIHLLLTANWEDKEWHGKTIKRGQVLTTQIQLAKDLDILDANGQPTRQPIRTALSNLQKTQDLTIKTFNKYSIITINNYDSYQLSNQQNPNKTPTDNQKINQQNPTPKEEKNNIYIHTLPNIRDLYIYIYNNYSNKFKTDQEKFLAVIEFLDYYKKEGHKLSKDWVSVLKFWIDFENCMKELKENNV